MKTILLSYKKTTNGNYRFYNVETGEVIPWLAGVWAPMVGIERIHQREQTDKTVKYFVVDDGVADIDVAELTGRCRRIRDKLKAREYTVQDVTQEPVMDTTHSFSILFRQIERVLIDLDPSMRREMFQRKRELLSSKKTDDPQ